ncbi:MAG: alpha/beta hydrolase [Bacillaceae bacterium]|nr:alpha/beta hydrolase [Bacillaceae bacterium]
MIKKILGGYTPEIKDENGNPIPNSLAQLEKIRLGGIDQWITIRSHNKSHPILLILHGGPGASQTGAFRKYNSKLEEIFTVIHWEQRGSAKSFSEQIPDETMTLSQIQQDLHELIEKLKKKFNKEKIYLLGQSIGALYGLIYAREHPDNVYAFVGVNQPLNRAEEEKLSFHYVQETVNKEGTRKEKKLMKKNPILNHGGYRHMDGVLIQRRLLTKYGGVTYRKNAIWIQLSCLLASELTLMDKFRFLKGLKYSMEKLWPELLMVNFFDQVTSFDVPIYLCMGEHDKIVHHFARDYIKKMNAPRKELVVFEESGHLACFEEPNKFNRFMIDRVLRKEDKDK